MRYKTVEVAPFHYNYRAYNKLTAECVERDSLTGAVAFVNGQPRRHPQQPRLSYTLKLEAETRYISHHIRVYNGEGEVEQRIAGFSFMSRNRVRDKAVYASAPAADWVVINPLGEAASKDDIEAAFRALPYVSRWETSHAERHRRNLSKERRLIRVKGSPRKVKASCQVVPDTYSGYRNEESYSNLVRGYYGRPRTTSERRKAEGHINEYGEGLVRGKRRPHMLPSYWDDKPCSMWDTEKNWKHGTKRRKQWIPN